MLSYRHAFHAGNHADVLKHIIWGEILGYLKHKEAPFYIHDTHAGAGLYEISSDMMQKTQEYQTGIAEFYDDNTDNDAIKTYCEYIKSFNKEGGALSLYPGSPALSQLLLRPQDRMVVTDLHSTEYPVLEELFKYDKRVRVCKIDAYEGLLAQLPPKERRGAVLIDPSYEIKSEYNVLPQKLGKALTKFPTGTYAIWYPVLKRTDTESFIKHLVSALHAKNHKNPITYLRAELCVSADREDGFGMVGSGMFIVNPPYVLKGVLDDVMPILKQRMADKDGQYILTTT
jgi:23S rRNA (adenine2030-N6)-methyltransferase